MRNPFHGRSEIGRREADRLLDRSQPVDPSHRAVADLLAAAAGPALPHETRGERAAVRRFRQAYAASARPASRHRQRRIAALVTATAAAVLLGGTAYATGSGHLPEPLQRTAHDWLSGVGVPPPGPASPSPSPSPSPVPSRSLPPALSPTAGASLVRNLCVAWQAVEADPGSQPLTPEDRHALGNAAGSNGKKEIDEFCARLLGSSAEPPAPSASTGRGKPGNPSPGNPTPGVKKPHK